MDASDRIGENKGFSIWNNLSESQINGIKTGGVITLGAGVSYLVTTRLAGIFFAGVGIAGVAAVAKNPEYRTGNVQADLTKMCGDFMEKITSATSHYFNVDENDKGTWATLVRSFVALLPSSKANNIEDK